jgi:glycosyltransferase involved in cell wall biosynthesis
MARMRVIFATTAFEQVATGPAAYARYLWDAFGDDDEIEFHLVAPSAAESHPRLHAVGGRGRQVYARVAAKARELAAGRERETILHGNAAHAMYDLRNYPGPWAVQVNDYEVAELWPRAGRILRRRGWRRLASLIWRRRRERRVARSATRVVCNSEYTRQAVRRAYGLDAARAIAIHKGVDTAALARPASLPPDPVPGRPAGGRIAFVGSHWQIKGLDVLLGAVYRLVAGGLDVTLAVAGEDRSPGAGRMRRMCERLALGDRVRFAGRLGRGELAALLWHSDVLALPSRQEAFGVAALEALAAGVPVVASRVGGLPEIVRDGRDGVLVEAEDPAALAGAIAEVLGDDRRRREMAASGPERAAEFGTDRMVAAVREMYRSMRA